MKLPKLKIGDVVEVFWEDSSVYENGVWVNEDVYTNDSENVIIRTVSIYLGRAKGFIKLCGDRYDAEGLIGKISRGFEIPIGCIKEVYKLRRE